MKLSLMKNYLSFMEKIRTSSKTILRQLYMVSSSDVRTVTGTNLRNILLLTDKVLVDDLKPSIVANIKYHEIDEKETLES